MQRYFERRLFMSFGKRSFSVYLLHWIMLLYLTPPVMISMMKQHSYQAALLISVCVTVAIMVPLCILLDFCSNRLMEYSIRD